MIKDIVKSLLLLSVVLMLMGMERPAELNQDTHKHFYVRHLTDNLPSPLMIVGGISKDPNKKAIKARPTAHWSLPGTQAEIETQTVHIVDGSVTYKESSLMNKKYAILERLDVLAPKVIGGEIFDIFTFGNHALSQYAYLFVPRNEVDKIKAMHNYECNFEVYEADNESAADAVKKFIKANKFISIQFAKAALRWGTQPWVLPENVEFIDKLIKVDPELAQSATFTDNQLWHENEPSVACVYTSIKCEDYSSELLLLNFNVQADKFLSLWTDGQEKSDTRFLRHFCFHLQGKENFDVLLFTTDHQKTSFKRIFERYNIPVTLCNASHKMSGLVEVETEIRRTPHLIIEKITSLSKQQKWPSKADLFEHIKVQLRNEFSHVVTNKLTHIPDSLLQPVKLFFYDAHEEILTNFLGSL